jgi:hypothetical protein
MSDADEFDLTIPRRRRTHRSKSNKLIGRDLDSALSAGNALTGGVSLLAEPLVA